MASSSLVLLGNACFVLVMGLLGVRLLTLARRTRQLPELLLGLALCGMVTAIPVLAVSGMGRATAGELSLGVFCAGFALLWVSLSAMLAFTWRAFRPEAGWAAGICVVCSALLLGIVGGAIHAVVSADPETPATAAARSWVVNLRVVLIFAFSWTAVEAFGQYRMARRRLAVGLGDPVVTNRFLLWAWTGASMVISGIVLALLQRMGMGILTHALPAFLQGVGSLIPAVLMALAFMPPQAYLRFIGGKQGADAPVGA